MSLASLVFPRVAPAPAAQVRPRSIASHLALLCIAVALPILACVSALLWRSADAEQRKLENRGIASVREISEILDIDILSLSAILRTLTTSSYIQTSDYESFYNSAREVTGQTGLSIVLSDPDGRVVFNTSRLFGMRLPDVDANISKTAETKQTTVTDLIISGRTGHAMYAVAVPVFRRGTTDVTHVLHFIINTQRIRDILLRNIGNQNVVRASVIDRSGRILARSLNNESAQGLFWPGLAQAGDEKEGVFRHKNLEGVEALTSFVRMRSTGWIVVNGVDTEVVDRPLRLLIWQLVGIAALTAAVAGLIGLFLSRRLLGSLHTLESNTMRIGAGAPLRKVVTSVVEVNRIGDVLMHSARELQEANEARDALLYEVNHRVKNSLAVVTSILSMQARQTSNALEKRALFDLRSRIEIIARVHQSLYESGHHNSVNVGDFLKEVATTTLQALDTRDNCHLTATCDHDVVMPVYRTTPLALIAAELLTNAVKHAQKADRRCNITLRFSREGEHGLSLLIADDGDGLGADFDPLRSTGVGMRIITGLLKQLRARMTTNAGERGACFLIKLDEAHRE